MDMGTTSYVGIYRFGTGLYIVADIVDNIEGGFSTDRSEVVSLEVGLTVVNIG